MSPEGYWSYTFTQVDHDDYSGKVALIARSDSPTGHGFYSDHPTLYWIVAGLIVASVLVWLLLELPRHGRGGQTLLGKSVVAVLGLAAVIGVVAFVLGCLETMFDTAASSMLSGTVSVSGIATASGFTVSDRSVVSSARSS